MSQSDMVDPRQQIAEQITEGQIYEDDRYDRRLAVVFVSDDIVVCREVDIDDDERTLKQHRLDTRYNFEQNVGAGRYDLLDDEVDVTGDAVSKLEGLLERYENEDGRKASHKATAIEEALTLLQNEQAPDAHEPVDFEAVDGIGATTAENLRNAGIRLKTDVRSADDETLLSVGGIGDGNLRNLRDHIEQ